ncbi:hypothetical protein P5673_018626 [Acropora cervicornis]|uniref:Uncharacterized protein n=1 Tax=Acropora cervicornis TaxID=6130 RepID=A0AAD9QCZ1_ACRCE|nr:hypothetical protein P5673_018626 [Acropora cervicornis]
MWKTSLLAEEISKKPKRRKVKQPQYFTEPPLNCTNDLSYAKLQRGVKSRHCDLLGLKWNKSADEIAVTILVEVAQPTK